MDRSRPIVFLMTLLLASWLGPAARAADAAWEFCVSVNPDNRIATCTQVLARGATLSAHDRAMAYAYRGDAYATKANYDRAIQDYNEAIRLDPKYAHAYTVRGASYANKANYDRAIQDYNEAIRLDPKYALAYTRRGDAYYNRHAYAEARVDYDQAQALDLIDSKAAHGPDFAPALCHGEYGTRSHPSTSPINFHIRNSSTNTIRVYWINFEGRRQWYADVLPSHDYNARSYVYSSLGHNGRGG
jgi:tetratricopeptide (TPR) repeat protein